MQVLLILWLWLRQLLYSGWITVNCIIYMNLTTQYSMAWRQTNVPLFLSFSFFLHSLFLSISGLCIMQENLVACGGKRSFVKWESRRMVVKIQSGEIVASLPTRFVGNWQFFSLPPPLLPFFKEPTNQ